MLGDGDFSQCKHTGCDDMGIEWDGINELARALKAKSSIDFDEVSKKSIRSIYKRSQRAGGTPVGNYSGGGQLRMSASYRGEEIGYIKDYAPHVEYGHRTRNGGYVPGQYYLKGNVDKEKSLYKKRLKEALREGD